MRTRSATRTHTVRALNAVPPTVGLPGHVAGRAPTSRSWKNRRHYLAVGQTVWTDPESNRAREACKATLHTSAQPREPAGRLELPTSPLRGVPFRLADSHLCTLRRSACAPCRLLPDKDSNLGFLIQSQASCPLDDLGMAGGESRRRRRPASVLRSTRTGARQGPSRPAGTTPDPTCTVTRGPTRTRGALFQAELQRRGGTSGGGRTRAEPGLSRPPLPLGYRGMDRAGRPATGSPPVPSRTRR
jgi:hypothetical protein